jgi:glycosyltransferase involved in cell wall biosynthesis
MLTYAIVTPARNEASNLGRLAAALTAQSVLPESWLIVDNGSTDDTPRLAEELADVHPWIGVLRTPGEDRPRRGAPVVRAFHEGLQALPKTDVVVKLDADVSFEPDYFERLLGEFERDPLLGMASGREQQLVGGTWRPNNVTADHVWGPARAYRRACLDDVSPLEESLGWDAIDEIKARLSGWNARHIPDLPFRHHRPVGARDGGPRGWVAHGTAAHYLCYRPSYVVLRSLFRMRRQRWAPAMIWGYAAASVTRQPRCGDPRVRAYIREQQRMRRLPLRALEVLGKQRRPAEA